MHNTSRTIFTLAIESMSQTCRLGQSFSLTSFGGMDMIRPDQVHYSAWCHRVHVELCNSL